MKTLITLTAITLLTTCGQSGQSNNTANAQIIQTITKKETMEKSLNKQPDIYVVGNENVEKDSDKTVAKLWINGVEQNLTDGSTRAQANSVYVSGDDVYIAGTEERRYRDEDNTGYHFKYTAVLWKNGVMQDLEYSGSAQALSVHVSGGDVYVAGMAIRYIHRGRPHGTQSMGTPILWKNGVPQILKCANKEYGAYATDVYVSGGVVYVSGYGQNAEGKNVAILWKNGVEQHLTEGVAISVHVSGGDVFVAGYDGMASQARVVKLWKNGVEQNLTDGTRDATAHSVYVSDGNVYVSGREANAKRISVAKLCKNGVEQNLARGKDFSEANAVFVHNGDVYAVGNEDSEFIDRNKYIQHGRTAILWINGEMQQLTDGKSDAVANSVFVK
jgi:hypothetical protein